MAASCNFFIIFKIFISLGFHIILLCPFETSRYVSALLQISQILMFSVSYVFFVCYCTTCRYVGVFLRILLNFYFYYLLSCHSFIFLNHLLMYINSFIYFLRLLIFALKSCMSQFFCFNSFSVIWRIFFYFYVLSVTFILGHLLWS